MFHSDVLFMLLPKDSFTSAPTQGGGLNNVGCLGTGGNQLHLVAAQEEECVRLPWALPSVACNPERVQTGRSDGGLLEAQYCRRRRRPATLQNLDDERTPPRPPKQIRVRINILRPVEKQRVDEILTPLFRVASGTPCFACCRPDPALHKQEVLNSEEGRPT